MTYRPSVLVSTGVFLPGTRAGGPIKSLQSLISAESQSANIRVLTSDRDHAARTSYPGISHLDERIFFNNVPVVYFDKRRTIQLAKWFINETRKHKTDILYLNSLFSPKYSIFPLILWRFGLLRSGYVILAPRGELGSAAKRQKRWKKAPIGSILRRIMSSKRAYWQATSGREYEDIVKFAGHRAPRVIEFSNHWPPPSSPSHRNTDDTQIDLTFIARIVPIKGLDLALEALTHTIESINFHIVGEKENIQYWERCRKLIDGLPENVNVTIYGHLTGDKLADVLANTTALLLPTAGENFGHSIAECLSMGIPCIIPPTTPWTQFIRDNKAGELPNREPEAIAAAISNVASRSQHELAIQREDIANAYCLAWTLEAKSRTSLFNAVPHTLKRST